MVKQRKLLEWSRETDGWSATPLEAIDDRCFVRPLPASALLGATLADDAVMQALRAKRHPEFLAEREEGVKEGVKEGFKKGEREALKRLFAKCLGRPLADAELRTLVRRHEKLGLSRLEDVALELRGGALAAWLADPAGV